MGSKIMYKKIIYISKCKHSGTTLLEGIKVFSDACAVMLVVPCKYNSNRCRLKVGLF